MSAPAYVTAHLADPVRATFWCVEFSFPTPQRLTDCDQPIIIGGSTYAPTVLKVDGVRDAPGDESAATAGITIGSGDGGIWQALLGAITDDDRHPAVTIHQVWLDIATLSPTTAAVWTRATGRVESAEWGTLEARFTVGLTADPAIMRLPLREYSERCSYRCFKGPQCGYAGAATSCDRAYATCVALGNQARFGGFRFITPGPIELKWIWIKNGVIQEATVALSEREATT